MTNISVRGETTPVVEQAARILRERRTGSGPQVLLEVCAESPSGAEGFEIADSGGGVRITARDGRGLLYGVGKHLRDSAWRGVHHVAADTREHAGRAGADHMVGTWSPWPDQSEARLYLRAGGVNFGCRRATICGAEQHPLHIC